MIRKAIPLELGQALGRLQNGYYGFRCLAAALELGLVSALATGRATAAELARRTSTDPRALARLLDALVAVGVVEKQIGAAGEPARYALEPGFEAFAADEPGLSRHYQRIEAAWGQLAAAVREGKPLPRAEGEPGAFFADLVGALFATNRRAAEIAAEAVAAERAALDGLRVLDVGAGSGVWGLMLALRVPGARVWALDHPAVLPVTRRFFAEHGAADRLVEVPADYNEVELGDSDYDVVILGHVLHSAGRDGSRRLIAKSARALAAGGTLVIGEFIADEARSSRENPRPLLFAVNMLLLTEEGDAYTLSEMTAWLREAGFAGARTVPVPGASPVVLAARAGR